MIRISISNRRNILPSLCDSWISSQNSSSCSRGYHFNDEDDFDYCSLYNYWEDCPGWDDEADYIGYGHRASMKRDKRKHNKGGETDIRDILADNVWDDDLAWDDIVAKYDTENKVRKEINKFLGVSIVDDKQAKMRHRKKKKCNQLESDLFESVHNQKEQEEQDWRKEILESNTLLDESMRSIFFYNDGRDESSAEHFGSLDEFLNYCTDNMIYIDADTQSDLEFYIQCHCALDDYSLDRGWKELRVARSYGELVYDLYGEELYSVDSSLAK